MEIDLNCESIKFDEKLLFWIDEWLFVLFFLFLFLNGVGMNVITERLT